MIYSLPALQRLGDQPYDYYAWNFTDRVAAPLVVLETLLQRLDSDPVSRAARVKYDTTRRAYAIDLSGFPISDLSILPGLPICSLDLRKTGVADLSPIDATLLEVLNLGQTQVVDLRPLARCRLLRSLYVYATKVTDLSPLVGLPLKQLYLHDSPSPP